MSEKKTTSKSKKYQTTKKNVELFIARLCRVSGQAGSKLMSHETNSIYFMPKSKEIYT